MIKVLMMPIANEDGWASEISPVMAMAMQHVQGDVWRQIELTPSQTLVASEQCPEPNRWFVLDESE